MRYRALLFCPDEKTAQTVTLVLNDLEFTVEACSEPFAAVKKLMGEHFDGVVVDCDNEQNAMLLFKSARQSASNQASLAVAVVEGQAGVAKAFRIGANLVLTKPINLEQAKGTLRVARGLLRKSEAAKAPAQAERVPLATPSARTNSVSPQSSVSASNSQVSSSTQAAARKAPTLPAESNPWGSRVSDSRTHSASGSAQRPPESDFSAEELPIPPESISPVATAPSILAPASTAVFSAMQQIAKKASGPLNSESSTPASPTLSASSASAATARSEQRRPAAEPLLSKIARTVGTVEELTEGNDSESSVIAMAKPVPDAPLSGRSQPDAETYFTKIQPASDPKSQSESNSPEGMSASRKALLAVVAVVLLVVAIYFGWAQLHGQTHPASAIGNPGGSVAAKLQPTAMPNAPLVSVQTALPSPVLETSGPHDLQPAQKTTQAPSNHDQNGSASDSTDDVSVKGASNKVSVGIGAAESGTHPLIVRSGKPNAAKRAATDAAAPSVVVSSEASSEALPNLIDVSVKSTPVLQTLTVSQGVSQGLIVKKVQPVYPATALHLHLEGPVHLMATVGKSGNITSVKTLNGDPLLAQAATDAVKQWKYKPYLLNGEPVEIQTQVTINFKLPR